MRHLSGRFGRWTLLSSNYDYRIEHKKGKENVVADSLSRLSLPTSKDDDPEEFFEHVLLNIDKEKRPRQLWEISVITNESKKPETVLGNSEAGETNEKTTNRIT